MLKLWPVVVVLWLAPGAAGFEGVASADCQSLTWDETRDQETTVYRLTSACKALFTCPAGSYCAAGAYLTSAGASDASDFFMSTWSTDTRRCAVVQGFDNVTYGYACACGYGFWCAQDTALPRFCPKEYYCRTPATINECRAGQYCKEGSVFGRPCSRFSNCPRESARPQGSGGAVIIFLVLIVLAFGAFRAYEALNEKRIDAANREMEDYLDHLGSRDDDDDAVTEKAKEEEESGPKEGDVELGDLSSEDDDKKESKGGTGAEDTTPPEEEEEKDKGFLIEFEDVRLTLPNGVTIMRGPCGKFAPGRSCAIMGASGAGKTTIMNLIFGKVKKTGGVIRVNGEECESLERWKSRVGFVPQEDVMHRRLTVMQNISFSAHLRLPATLDENEKRRRINKVLVSLNLDKIRHSIIGDEFQRGISGGQRKRVNVGLELVADPKVCFLDEPTSGLDSVSATELCRMLRSLAEADDLTIAAVIHSPGPAAFASFHDFMLLQTGGRPVYFGPTPEVRDYFKTIGFTYDAATMVDPLADYIMKAVAGTHQPDLDAATLKVEGLKWDHMTSFHELWHLKTGKAPPQAHDDDDVKVARAQTRLRKLGHLLKSVAYDAVVAYPKKVLGQLLPRNDAKSKDRRTPTFCAMFALCFKRACRQVYVTFLEFTLSAIVVFFALGTFTAAISSSNLNVLGGYPADICAKQYPGLRAQCRDLQQNSYVSALQFVGFIVVAANSAVASATFGAEQAIYWREASTNLNTSAYFFAKVVADLPMAVVHALATAAGYSSGFVSPMSFGRLYLGVLLITCFGYLSGYFLSFTLPYSACGLAGVGWAVFWMLLYGGTTTLMSDNRQARWVWALSPGRWANEAWFDAGTVYPYDKVREGSEKGEDLFDFSRAKSDYLFYLPYGDAIGWGFLTLLCLLIIDLLLINATKLDKKR